MCDAQIHRGPDDEGYYADGPVSLGIRRLAIIDLAKGLYPLTNEERTIHLVFNGEIYDFSVIRKRLEDTGHTFRTSTDAEVLVHAYEEWDTNCFQNLNGMFAFALWDSRKRIMLIARDNFGIKPLYYHYDKNSFVFASEIKPLLLHPSVSVTPNEGVIDEYLRDGIVDQREETFFSGVFRLSPAHFLIISPEGSVTKNRYWRPQISSALEGEGRNRDIVQIRQLFLDTIRRQLVSDVPLGTCLSGGIDSSSVVCAINHVRPHGEQIRTFTASFPNCPIDEAEYAQTVCNAANAGFNPVMPTAAEFWKHLPTLVRCQEEPFLSTSIYAQWRVMKKAAERGITVLLDGQGGDELFCGYAPYYLDYLVTLKRNRRYCKLLVEGLLSVDLTYRFIIAYLTNALRKNQDRSSCIPTEKARNDRFSRGDLVNVLERLVTSTSLPALLRYEDKNSMWHSIEARVPFLDRTFFEYAASLPLDRKLRKGWTKYVFRESMKGILPDKIRLRRSKIGFETPERQWITHDLRDTLREFFRTKLLATKFYDAEIVKKLLEMSSLRDSQVSLIWRTLNLELWYREFFAERT